MTTFLLTRVAWPLVMGLITFVAVRVASHDTAIAFFIALLPTVLGFINVFRVAGYAVTGLAVIYAVYVFVTPAGTRAQIAASASSTVARATSRPNATANNTQGDGNTTASAPPPRHRHHHAAAG